MSTSQTAAKPASITYSIDPTHTAAHFKVRHLMISWVRGEFTKISGTLTVNETNLAQSNLTVEIDVNSINTRVADRDKDLLSPNFLDAAKYPGIQFQSNKIVLTGNDEYRVTGDLTIHGVTRSVVLDVDSVTPEVKDPWGFYRRGAAAETTISRKAFGLTTNPLTETGGIVVGDEIQINIDVEFVRPA
jgi:polyisoprenoid-binding protein YceI